MHRSLVVKAKIKVSMKNSTDRNLQISSTGFLFNASDQVENCRFSVSVLGKLKSVPYIFLKKCCNKKGTFCSLKVGLLQSQPRSHSEAMCDWSKSLCFIPAPSLLVVLPQAVHQNVKLQGVLITIKHKHIHLISTVSVSKFLFQDF